MQMINSLSIKCKIYGLIGVMLLLTIAVSAISMSYIWRIKTELDQIAEYLVPITEKLNQISVHALEQEIALERLFTFFEVKPIPHEKIKRLLVLYSQEGELVKIEINQTKIIVDNALKRSKTFQEISGFSRLGPILNEIEGRHKTFQVIGLQLAKSLSKRELTEVYLFENLLEEEKNKLNKLLKKTLEAVKVLTERAVFKAEEHQGYSLVINWIIAGLAIFTGLILSAIFSSRMVKPLKGLLAATRKISLGNLDVSAEVVGKDEIGKLSFEFNKMVDGINQKERVKSTFGQYVDPRVVNSLINSHDLNFIQREPVTVFFSDIAGFSRISEQFTPAAMVKLVNEYLSLVSEPIILRQGVIDKFVGDAVVAFWSSPFVDVQTGALMSCMSALEQQTKIKIFKKKISEITGVRKMAPEINVRMGIATSECVVGNVGSTYFKSFTVIGPATGWAEELETLNKRFNTNILVLEPTAELVREEMELRRIDCIEIAPNTNLNVFELLGPVGAVAEEILTYRDQYEKALKYLEVGDKQSALVHFRRCKEQNPEDSAVTIHLENIEITG
jgi:class 3 adenylate cyclase